MSRPVNIVDYDPEWPDLYEKEKRRILEVAGDIIAGIEHVGSTAIPGIGAKPILDIMVAVNSLSDADECIEPLRKMAMSISLNMRLQCLKDASSEGEILQKSSIIICTWLNRRVTSGSGIFCFAIIFEFIRKRRKTTTN